MNFNRSLPWLIAAAALAGGLGLSLGQRWFAPREAASVDGVAATRNAVVFPQPRALADFALTRTDGQPLSLADWHGQWSLVFIGFTHCPDACPQTLALYRDIEKDWPADGPALPTLYFVSVDPERDDAQTLASYASYFSGRIVAATGSHAQLEPFAKQLGMIYMKSPTGNGDYTVDHSLTLALVGPDARLVALFRPPMDPAAVAEDLRTLVATR